MNIEWDHRGFCVLTHRGYPVSRGENLRLAQESSAIDFSVGNPPGGSFLWIGQDHHLSRQQVAEFIKHLQRWLDTGSLENT